MRRAMGLALAALMVVPGVAAQGPRVVTDEAWCQRMFPNRAAARDRCVGFLSDIRVSAIGYNGGMDATYALPETIIAALVWGGAERLGVSGHRGYVEWGDAAATPTPRPTARPTPVPKAMTPYSGDSALSYRWLEPSEFNCSYGDVCWGMMWRTTKACDSLFVELQYLNASDVVIGRGIETASLSAGQTARLVFESFERGARKARLQDVSCY